MPIPEFTLHDVRAILDEAAPSDRTGPARGPFASRA